ncbi:hypothetical protein HU675_0020685 [Bradyrhizobium septentrionale]|uniref:hypothetical protein n=1 Tax=Bradyrhizobium septentrionale TaxID=1404411 RepID=UPI00159684EF|nr:hypothetical protein [Bradyrhizobium septentrionale]UGY28981.1 hypothetical protein HU675_0020685 [Bradyrhizobium septentrionale]
MVGREWVERTTLRLHQRNPEIAAIEQTCELLTVVDQPFGAYYPGTDDQCSVRQAAATECDAELFRQLSGRILQPALGYEDAMLGKIVPRHHNIEPSVLRYADR